MMQMEKLSPSDRRQILKLIPRLMVYPEQNGTVSHFSAFTGCLNGLQRFKMHLRPPRLAAEQGFDTRKLPSLPRNKSAIDVFGDVLRYLFNATKRYIQERQGVDMWNSVEDDIHFILSHPNGWEGRQQAEMRRAAVTAGLVASEAEAVERVSFVTEGEASLHFCLNKIPTALEGFVRKNDHSFQSFIHNVID
jgi:hypothetical protein